MQEVKQGKYKHHKGKIYEVLGIGLHSETLEEFVVYRALYNDPKFGKNTIWIRPKKIFLEKVNINGKEVNRFERIE